MASRDIDALRSVPLFSELGDKALKHLASMLREERFGPGQVIATEGSSDGAGIFFIVDSGRAAVTKGSEVINSLGPGDWFGELALIMKGPRTATVTATEELRCRTLASFEFRAFAKEHGDVSWALLEQVVERLTGRAVQRDG